MNMPEALHGPVNAHNHPRNISPATTLDILDHFSIRSDPRNAPHFWGTSGSTHPIFRACVCCRRHLLKLTTCQRLHHVPLHGVWLPLCALLRPSVMIYATMIARSQYGQIEKPHGLPCAPVLPVLQPYTQKQINIQEGEKSAPGSRHGQTLFFKICWPLPPVGFVLGLPTNQRTNLLFQDHQNSSGTPYPEAPFNLAAFRCALFPSGSSSTFATMMACALPVSKLTVCRVISVRQKWRAPFQIITSMVHFHVGSSLHFHVAGYGPLVRSFR